MENLYTLFFIVLYILIGIIYAGIRNRMNKKYQHSVHPYYNYIYDYEYADWYKILMVLIWPIQMPLIIIKSIILFFIDLF